MTDAPDMFGDVDAFHEKHRLPRPRRPRLLDSGTLTFRTKFLVEELQEFRDACEAKDLEEAADALVDLCYVALGTAVMMGLPFRECWAEVQRANMAKVRASDERDARSHRAHVLDVVKPRGWRAPDHGPILERAGWVR